MKLPATLLCVLCLHGMAAAQTVAPQANTVRPPPSLPGAGRAPARPEPFTFIKVDKRVWKTRTSPLQFGAASFPEGLESPHFVVAGSSRAKPELLESFAEAGERLWQEMSTELPLFAETAGGRRMLILLPDAPEQMKALRHWYGKETRAAEWDSETERADRESAWMRPGVSYLALRRDFTATHNLINTARIFRVERQSPADLRNPVWPQRIHFLTATLFGELCEDVEADGPYNMGVLRLAYSYYKEWRAAGRIETEVAYVHSAREVEGFHKGRDWMETIRKLLEETAPSIDSLMSTPVAELHPRDVGFAFGLMHFIHSEPARLKSFDALLRQCRSRGKAPDGARIAAAFGFSSAAEFDRAWKAWMLGDNFR